MSKAIRDCLRFAVLCSVIGPKKLAPIPQPNRCKAVTNHGPVARALPRFRLFGSFTLNSYRLSKIFCFLLIGRCDYFGFLFMTLNRKRCTTLPNMSRIRQNFSENVAESNSDWLRALRGRTWVRHYHPSTYIAGDTCGRGNAFIQGLFLK